MEVLTGRGTGSDRALPRLHGANGIENDSESQAGKVVVAHQLGRLTQEEYTKGTTIALNGSGGSSQFGQLDGHEQLRQSEQMLISDTTQIRSECADHPVQVKQTTPEAGHRSRDKLSIPNVPIPDGTLPGGRAEGMGNSLV